MNRIETMIRSALGDDIVRFDYKSGRSRRKGWVKRIRREDGVYGLPISFVEERWRPLSEVNVRLFVGAGVVEIAPGKFADGYEDNARTRRRPPASYDQIFALPDLPVLDVIEFAEVGSHNAMPDEYFSEEIEIRNPFHPTDLNFASRFSKKDIEKMKTHRRMTPRGDTPWKYVRDAMQKVMEICAFEIWHADKAGMRAVFLKRISAKQSAEIADLVLAVNPESSDLALEELKRAGIKVPMMKKLPNVPDYEKAMANCIAQAGRVMLWWD